MRKQRPVAFALLALFTTGCLVSQHPTSQARPSGHEPLDGGARAVALAAHRSDPLTGLWPTGIGVAIELTALIPATHPAPPPPPPVTTTTVPPPTTTTTTAPPPPPPPPYSPLGGDWLALRNCESGDNYADDTGNGYYGAYQFSLGTWESLGYGGLPSNAPPQVQDQAAVEAQARGGWGQWPACASELGL